MLTVVVVVSVGADAELVSVPAVWVVGAGDVVWSEVLEEIVPDCGDDTDDESEEAVEASDAVTVEVVTAVVVSVEAVVGLLAAVFEVLDDVAVEGVAGAVVLVEGVGVLAVEERSEPLVV
jgi:hypothetical protein